jgi:hypothetical protein
LYELGHPECMGIFNTNERNEVNDWNVHLNVRISVKLDKRNHDIRFSPG